MKYFKTFLLVGILLILSSTIWADVPRLINFQGGLTDGSGTPVKDSTYSVLFTIYDDSAAGTNLWSETQSVATKGGTFNVNLGSSTALPDTIFNDTTRYLAMKVGTDPEMTPRQRIVSVAYGYRVRTVDGASGGTISGNTAIQSDLTVSGNFLLPASTASVGVIKSGADRFIHNFGDNNFFAGVNAGNFTLSGYGNIGVGFNALRALTTGYFNTAVGYYALYYNTTGYENTAVGLSALLSNTTGYYNTALGTTALYANSTGYDNTALGQGALYYNTTGYENTAVGRIALWNNSTGTLNTAIGFGADVSTGALTNATAIGAYAVVGTSNAMVLGGAGGNAVKVGIGTPTPQGVLDVVSTTGALIVPRMTTTQRDALTAVNGMIIYNTTTNQFNFREAGAWVIK